MRRGLSSRLLALLCVVGLLIAACGGQPATAPPQPAPAPAPAAAPAPAKPAAQAAQPAAPAAQPAAQPAQAAAPQPRRGGALRVAIIGEPPGIDLQASSAVITYVVGWHITETIYTFNSKSQIVPQLAEALPSLSADGATFTIKLRKDVKFHNGKGLTAEDAVASLLRWRKLAPSGRSALPDRVFESARAVDTHTMEIKLKETSGALLAALAQPNNGMVVYPKEIVEKVGDAQPVQGADVIGTGPYRLVEHVPDRHVRVRRFDDYAAPPLPSDGFSGKKEAYADEIFFIPTADPATRLAGVQAGDFNVVEQVDTAQYNQLKGLAPNVLPHIVGPSSWSTLHINASHPPLDNIKVRQAMAVALDLDDMMEAAMGFKEFYRIEPGTFFKEQTQWYSTAVKYEYFNNKDPEKAKAILAESGYNGEQIRLWTTREYPVQYKTSLVATEQWKPIGLNVELQLTDWATMSSVRLNRDRQMDWELMSTGYSLKYDPVSHVQMQSARVGLPATPAYIDLWNQVNRETDFAKRKAAFDKLENLWHNEVYGFRFGDTYTLRANRKEVQNMPATNELFLWNTWLAQ